MTAVEPRTDLMDMDRAAMRAFFASLGEKPFRGDQVFQWIHQHQIVDIDAMTNLARPLRHRIGAQTDIAPLEVVYDRVATDGTRKWLLRLKDGNCIETVFIPEADRGTLCVSSQAGCALNCTFCSTAQQGFSRNLSCGEIIGQLWTAVQALKSDTGAERPVTNVVMMGMGEPLLNFDNVVQAMGIMLDDLAYGLSRRRVTLSTSGIVPRIDALREACPVSLAVSLHAPTDALRDRLIPINRKYPLSRLMAACRRYVADQPRARVTMEYVMLEGVNDSPRHARQLVGLLSGIPAKVNLIPFNPFPGTPYARSAAAVIDRFREVLMSAGIVSVTRKTRGEEIAAACGQLVGRVEDRTRRSARSGAVSAE